MKKIISILLFICFSSAIFAEDLASENFFTKIKDKASELYYKYKDNKYVKYGTIGVGGALVVTAGTCFTVNRIENTRISKPGSDVIIKE